MNATPEPHEPVEPEFDDYEYADDNDGFGETLPVRPRQSFFTKWTAGLLGLILVGAGFYGGVRVEKSKIPSSSGSGATSAFAKAFSGAAGSGSKAGAGGFAGRGGGFAGLLGGGAAGDATTGSVSSVKGNTVYVTETSGNTVKVKLTGSTTISKSESVGKSKIYPGDQVVIQGAKGSAGTVNATSVTDSGASSTGTGSSSTASTGSSGSSAISSLFGGS